MFFFVRERSREVVEEASKHARKLTHCFSLARCPLALAGPTNKAIDPSSPLGLTLSRIGQEISTLARPKTIILLTPLRYALDLAPRRVLHRRREPLSVQNNRATRPNRHLSTALLPLALLSLHSDLHHTRQPLIRAHHPHNLRVRLPLRPRRRLLVRRPRLARPPRAIRTATGHGAQGGASELAGVGRERGVGRGEVG